MNARLQITELIAALAVGFALASCATAVVSRAAQADSVMTEADVHALERAEHIARGMWADVGLYPPRVPVALGDPGQNGDRADGRFYPKPSPHIVIRAARADVLAHELGHAMGLGHVVGVDEIMAPSVRFGAVIGPATLAEARRVGAFPRDVP